MSNENPTLARLEDQINWYDGKSQINQRLFKSIKAIEIMAAAMIPLFAGLGYTLMCGVLGALVVILEGVIQLYQFQSNWMNYRSTCEQLKHEKFLYLAQAGHYTTTNNPAILLAERVEELVSREHAKWVSTQENSTKAKGSGNVS